MKGQYRVLTEVMIFGIGIAITSFIILSFQTVENSISKISLEDNLLSVSNIITTSIVKVADGDTDILRLKIPQSIAEQSYLISIDNDMLVLRFTEKPEINVTQQLFNITQNHNIIIMGNFLDSSSRYLEISSDNGVDIIIRKWRL
jgi:hypothetical protein